MSNEEPPRGPNPNARLRELLSIPERMRTDAQWDEIIEIEISQGPRKVSGNVSKSPGRSPNQPQNQGQNQGAPRQTESPGWASTCARDVRQRHPHPPDPGCGAPLLPHCCFTGCPMNALLRQAERECFAPVG